MVGRGRRRIKCKNCGYEWMPNEVQPLKTWHLISPMPDKQGRITVTVMAVWECPKCGSRVRGVMAKTKIGEESFRGQNRTQKLIKILSESKRVSLEELAKHFNTDIRTIRMAIEYLLKKGMIRGAIKGSFFVSAN
ncbi:MAG: HTH domain-containing protein [Candidatus Njordarchaeales archaeon]